MNVTLVGHGTNSLPPKASANPGVPATGNAGAIGAPVSGAINASSPAVADSNVSSEQLQNAMEAVNKFIEPATNNLEFEIDAQSGRTVMKLIDKETGSVLRQLPSEEMLALARALDKLSGLVIKLKV